jgi:hypothetical protein
MTKAPWSAKLKKTMFGSSSAVALKFVQLTGLTDEDTFSAWAAVLKLPAQNEAQLMRKLLEMNWSGTFEACFGILTIR